MNAKWGFLILLLAALTTCSDDPYPVYEEGELQWIVTDTPILHNASVMEPLATPDGKHVVFLTLFDESAPGPQIMKRDLVTGTESLIYTSGSDIDLSPNGHWLLFLSPLGVSKIKLNGDSLTVLPLASAYGNYHPAWGPDGMSVAYAHHASDAGEIGGLFILTSDGKNEYVAATAWPPNFFPDGKRIISTKPPDHSWHRFQIYDIETKAELARLDGSPNETNEDPQVSPDGEQILYWNKNGIQLMNSDGSNVRMILPSVHFYEHPQGDYLGFLAASASWHPDGKHIVYQHFAITKYEKCPDFCTYNEIFTGIVSIRKLRVVD